MTCRERGAYKRGEIWWIDYTDLRGKCHQERVGLSYRVAVRSRRQRLADIEAGKFGLRHRGRGTTLQTFVDQHWRPEVARGLRPATKRSYEANLRTHLVPAFGPWPLGVISRGDVRAFVAELRSENPMLTPKTIKTIVGLLGALLEYAARAPHLLMRCQLGSTCSRIPAGCLALNSSFTGYPGFTGRTHKEDGVTTLQGPRAYPGGIASPWRHKSFCYDEPPPRRASISARVQPSASA